MDSKDGEGRADLGAAPLRADRHWRIFCNILQAGGAGRGIISLQGKGDEQSHGTGRAHSAV